MDEEGYSIRPEDAANIGKFPDDPANKDGSDSDSDFGEEDGERGWVWLLHEVVFGRFFLLMVDTCYGGGHLIQRWDLLQGWAFIMGWALIKGWAYIMGVGI